MTKKNTPIIEIKNFKGTREELLARYPDVRPTTAAPKDDTADLDGRWICAPDLESDFTIGETYPTREEAIAGAVSELGYLKVGQWFDVGQLSRRSMLVGLPTNADWMLEHATDSLTDEWHEGSIEKWHDQASVVSAELEGALNTAWDTWIARHRLSITGYHVEKITKHAIGADAAEQAEQV